MPGSEAGAQDDFTKMNDDKVKIRLNIAGESLLVSVPYISQELTRQTEAEINLLFDTWRSRFPEKSDRELLVMIAFRYADRYSALLREMNAAHEEAVKMEAMLDGFLSVSPAGSD